MHNNDDRSARGEHHDSAIEIFDTSKKLIAVGKLADFSKSGASFRATLILAVGDKILARLRLLEEGVFEISAHVVWVRKETGANFYGVKFDSIETMYTVGELNRPYI